MSVLSVQSLAKSFGGKTLFSDVTFDVSDRERCALVGKNGCGKTTIFRLLTGEQEADSGTIALRSQIRLGYAAQEAAAGADSGAGHSPTVYEEALEVFAELLQLEADLAALHEEIEHTTPTAAQLERQDELRESFARQEGMTCRARTRSALLGLGFTEEMQDLPAAALSGGQREKLRLGRLLLSGADLLLLDEPTNHLDLHAVQWLEGYLRDYKGAVLLISHDRYFIDRVCTKTVLMQNGTAKVYKGNYSEALQAQARAQEETQRRYENQMAEIERIEAIIAQQRRFNQERNYVTIASKQKQIDRLKAELVIPESRERTLRFCFPEAPVSGNEVLRLRGLAKSFGETHLFSNVNALLEKGQRVCIVGKNGCGKTTLLQIIRRRIKADDGYAAFGANVKPGYYDQDLSGIAAGKTVLEELRDAFPRLTDAELRGALGRFLFRGDEVFAETANLSGGERARLLLLKLLLSGANLLLLDEPTNHLDIPSREALESALLEYSGTILFVSHDRYLMEKLEASLWELTEAGLLPRGSAKEYFETAAAPAAAPMAAPSRDKPPNEYQRRKSEAAARRKQEAALRRTEAEISRMEESIAALEAEIASPDISAEYTVLLEKTALLDTLRRGLEHLFSQWEALAAGLPEEI